MSVAQPPEVDPTAGRRSGRRLNPSLVVGGLLVLLVVAMALVSFVWTPYDPTLVDPTSRLLTPSAQHWLGTDKFGRDEPHEQRGPCAHDDLAEDVTAELVGAEPVLRRRGEQP